MPGAYGNMKKSRRLTVAGLIVVTAGTLLMMAWAVFPTAAFASTEVTPWGGNGSDKLPCAGTTHWIFSGWGNDFDEVSNPILTVNGVQYNMSQQGNGNVFEAFVPGPLAVNPTASASWTWNEDGDKPTPVLTISECVRGTTSTTTDTTTTDTTTTETTTSSSTTETTTSSTTGTTTSGTTSTGTTTSGTTSTGTTTSGTTSTGTTTSGTTSVGPTTVTPTSDDETTTEEETVSPTTVTPDGVAFTGPENVIPLGALALTLLTSGSGLLWAGARRRRSDEQE